MRKKALLFRGEMWMSRRTCCTGAVDDHRDFILRLLESLIVRIHAGFALQHFSERRNLQYLKFRAVFLDVQDLQLPLRAVHEL